MRCADLPARAAALLGALTLAALPPTDAHAASCCAGASATIVPTRLDSCESALVGLSLSGEHSFGRWDARRMPSGSSLRDRSLVTTAAAAWRWDDKGQVDVSLPVRLNHRSAGDLSTLGGGAGDVVTTVRWDLLGDPTQIDAPTPVITVGGRLPTGRSWDRSDDDLLGDVTGLPGGGLIAGLGLDQMTGPIPWSLTGTAELWLSPEGPIPTFRAAGAVGQNLGPGTVGLLTLRHEAIRAPGGLAPGAGSRTAAGLRLLLARQNAMRLWAGAEVDLPLPGLGQDRLTVAAVSTGLAVVR